MSSNRKGGRGGHSNSEAKKKEAILDLSKYMDQKIIVKYQGGRQGTVYWIHRGLNDVY